MEQGDGVVLAPGTAFALRNDDQSTATVLRLRLVSEEEADAPDTGDVARATPVAPTVSLEPGVLSAADVDDFPEGPVSVVMARTVWAPGAAVGDHTASGPVGFYVEAGVLTVGRP